MHAQISPSPSRPAAHSDAAWRSFREVIHGRRSVRDFADVPVAEADMNDLLDAALVAPTSANLQPFELCWARSASARRRLVSACLTQRAARTAAELVVCVARWDRCEETRREIAAHLEGSAPPPIANARYDHLVSWLYDLGRWDLGGRARAALLGPLAWVAPMPRGPIRRDDVRAWSMTSAALVCQSFMLAARAKGLDTCALSGIDPVRVGDIAGMAGAEWRRTWDVSMVLAVGYRSSDAPLEPRWRRDRDKLVREV